MQKEILLYTNINSYSSSDFITAMQEVGDNDVCVRINGTGGDPTYGFGMIAKFQEHKGKKLIKVDGQAHSMYAFLLCYVDDSESLEVAEFLIHRAAYPEWFENNPEYFTADVRENVERINTFLRKAFEAKVDVAKFEAIAGVKIKDIFSLDGRLEVTLTASDAKKIGLINRIVKITPEKSAEIKSLKAELTAQQMGVKLAAEAPETEIKNQNPNTMTLEELKAKHPTVYAEAVAVGKAEEKDRVEACLVYNEFDPAGVKAAIEAGKPLSQKQVAEFGLKAMSKNALAALGAESNEDVTTGEDAAKLQSEKEKKFSEIEALARKKAGLPEKK